MNLDLEKVEGLRERKKRQTLQKIAETGLKLFIKNGYEATTLDMIAAATGISRRTFFYYFKSKEDILLAWRDGGFLQALGPALREKSPGRAPLDAARECFLQLASRYETKESVIVDQLLQSTEALRARKEVDFVEMERVLADTMCDLWPSLGRDLLCMVALMAIGTLRLALKNWRQEDGKHSLVHYLRQSFALLESQVPRTARVKRKSRRTSAGQ